MTTEDRSWQRAFKGQPDQAYAVRRWTRARIASHDAEQVAHELFVILLGASPDVVTVTLSTADARVRITTAGPRPLPVRAVHGPGRRIVTALSALSGVTADTCGMWAQLPKE